MSKGNRIAIVTAWICLILCLSACLPASTLSITASPVPQTLWGAIYPIAQAEYAPAPGIISNSDSALLAWVDADNERVYHALRQWRHGVFAEVVIPVVPAQNPFEQSLYAAGSGGYHLLWMDKDPETDELRLFSAYINRDLIAEIAPSAISDKQTTHYTAIPDSDESLWVVWSGGLLSEPALSVLRVDSFGRPMFPEPLQLDGDYPVFVQAQDKTIYLFWISRIQGRVMRARFVAGRLEDTQLISTLPEIRLSDRLENFHVAFDSTHQYLFWNISRENGTNETYLASSPIANADLISPLPLKLSVDTSKTIQTGFNSGRVYTAASAGTTSLSWASPLNETSEILPVAVLNGVQLGIIYLQGGAIIGYQSIVESGRLLAEANLRTDRDRHLYLTWSQVTAYGVANLNLTSTRAG